MIVGSPLTVAVDHEVEAFELSLCLWLLLKGVKVQP
jgi:hypothetical protein